MPRKRRTEAPPRGGKKRKPEKAAAIPRQIARTGSCDTEPPSVYLVVGHDVTRPAYSIVKVNPFSPRRRSPIPIPRHLARLESKHCMSFVAVRSRHGPWIVGVGGNASIDYGPETIVFDTRTHQVIPGPKLLSTKFRPILLPVGEKIYALTREPAMKGEINFVPWFEVLDLSQARVVSGRLVDCKWEQLPRPPCFPWELSPRHYIFPPVVRVRSFVAVNSCILVSTDEQKGTHMFNLDSEQWAKLDDKDLPFTGGAAPHGPLFLGFSTAAKKITAYKITVCAADSPSPSITAGCPSLSIVLFPMVDEAGEEVVSNGKFVSLGNHGFCSFRCRTDDLVLGTLDHTRELVTMRTYATEDHLSQDHLKSIRHIVISNQLEQVYSVRDSLRGLSWPSLVDVISL
ncbi:hypothetical protein ACQJBY_029282 [Aegilops geniculata]